MVLRFLFNLSSPALCCPPPQLLPQHAHVLQDLSEDPHRRKELRDGEIYSCGVTFINFADFDLAEFVDEITVDCSLVRDIGKSSKNEKSSLLAQQGDSAERTVTFPKYQLLV